MVLTNEFILTNNQYQTLKMVFDEMEDKYDSICIASAFFSETETVLHMIESGVKVELIVSLRFPTNCYALEKIYFYQNVNVKFLLNDFHSKFYVFLKNGIPIASILGSSNFTNGGLENNIETNFFCKEIKFCTNLLNHFNVLSDKAHDLEPNDIAEYKKVFIVKQKNNQTKEEIVFNQSILQNRNRSNKSITKEAKEYLSFIKIVSEIKRVLKNELESYYPDIPPFIVIDHFWHWLKTVYLPENSPFVSPNENEMIKMFRDFYLWDQEKKYTEEMYAKARNIFNKYLTKEYIPLLTKENLIEIYSNLHSGESREHRFHSAKKFVDNNSIDKIKTAFMYLLYSNDDIVKRIDSLINLESNLKMEEFGSSCTQELIGWVFYDKYPMRNDKADFAVKFLGYKFDTD